MDSEGYLYVVGRMSNSERFKVYGDVVYAQPIEKMMSEMKGIEDIIVVGVQLPSWGDELAYCIV